MFYNCFCFFFFIREKSPVPPAVDPAVKKKKEKEDNFLKSKEIQMLMQVSKKKNAQ